MKKLLIKIITISVLAMLVSSCGSSAYDYRKDRIVSNIDVPLGKTVMAEKTGLSFKFDSIDQDSRCPISTKCVWGGVAVVNVTVMNESGASKPIKLSTINYEKYNKVEKVFGKDVELIDLLPSPAAGSGAKPEILQKLIKLSID